MLLCCMLLCCMLLCWRMGEARRERSIAACALVPAMGISCGRAHAGMRTMDADMDGAQAGCPWSRPRVFYSSIYLGLRRQGSSAPDDRWATAPRVTGRCRARTGANCLAAGSGLQLPCARAAAAWLGAKMRSWKAVVRVVVRSGGVSGGGVRGSRVALSSLHCATATATTCVRGGLGARAPAAADRPP